MNNVLLIGATGLLGSHLAKTYKPTIATTRFEDPVVEWQQYKNIDTVWLVARACRKQSPRRDALTKQRELHGIRNIVETFRDCCILFTSTKCVYGLTDNDIRPVSVHHIGNLFMHASTGIQNVPHTAHNTVDFSPLGVEHRIYAETKLAGEAIVSTAPKHSIYRIWDIVE